MSKLKPAKDIYEICFDNSLYNIEIDGIEYSKYIVYTDVLGVNYKVFIHDNLINEKSNIEFFIDNSNTNNRLILLAYEEDLPMYILTENNNDQDNIANHYTIRSVGTLTELLSDESLNIPNEALIGATEPVGETGETGETGTNEEIEIDLNVNDVLSYDSEHNDFIDDIGNYPLLNYETVKLFYNKYLDEENNEIDEGNYCLLDENENERTINSIVLQTYDILSAENSKPRKIIRHYKIIKKQHNINNTRRIYSKPEDIYFDYNIKEINQNPVDYGYDVENPNNLFVSDNANIYNDEGLYNKNIYKDENIKRIKYKSIEEFQKNIDDLTKLAKYSFINDISKNYKNDETFISNINDVINNFENTNYLYVRFAPSLEQKDYQIRRMLNLKDIHLDNDDNKDYVDNLIKNAHIPIWNDNILYSESKCDYVKEILEDDEIKDYN